MASIQLLTKPRLNSLSQRVQIAFGDPLVGRAAQRIHLHETGAWTCTTAHVNAFRVNMQVIKEHARQARVIARVADTDDETPVPARLTDELPVVSFHLVVGKMKQKVSVCTRENTISVPAHP